MIKTLDNLGQLKRSLAVEVPLEEIKPTYNKIFNKLKTIRLPGFRPGKYPKGWLQKRFSEQMVHEANDHLIPGYFNEIITEMKLRPATKAEIVDVSFESKAPFKFTLNFEVAPELEMPDYSKLQLEKKEVEYTQEDLDAIVSGLKQRNATYEHKGDDSVAEDGDRVMVDYSRTIEDKTEEEADQLMVLDDRVFKDIRENIIGMKTNENKEFSFTITEDYIKEDVGKTATFNFTIKGIEKTVVPELNEALYAQMNGATNEEEFNANVEQQVKFEKEMAIQQEYHRVLREQLPTIYGEFELPEKSLNDQEKQIVDRLKKENEEITDEELETKKGEELLRYKDQLRIMYILQQISVTESISPDEQEINQRFSQMAMMYGMQPNQLAESEIGYLIYQQARTSLAEEKVLDYVAKQVLGDGPETVDASGAAQ